MTHLRNTLLILLSGCVSFACAAQQRHPVSNEPPPPAYVFAWPFIDTSEMSPRGGTSQGEAVSLQTSPTEGWQSLQNTTGSARQRDRAAILAMAGEYRVSFDFLETVVFDPPFTPAKPYRSWATEKVYVIEDREDFISLQHILEMYVVDKDGKRQGPFVQKHWRQDWAYQPDHIHDYRGGDLWARTDVAPADRKGRWSQSVFQVDDSPRYAALGRWEHTPSFSSWTSEKTVRPLPRRERSVRSDYDVLVAVNRHTIVPQGWVHEEDNLKQGGPQGEDTVRAREIGVNRYHQLQDFDFAAADEYWEQTKPFWQIVRSAWAKRFAENTTLQIRKKCNDTSGFMAFFGFAEKLRGDAPPAVDAQKTFVNKTLDCLTQS